VERTARPTGTESACFCAVLLENEVSPAGTDGSSEPESSSSMGSFELLIVRVLDAGWKGPAMCRAFFDLGSQDDVHAMVPVEANPVSTKGIMSEGFELFECKETVLLRYIPPLPA
jgi:hypothetical protein